MLISEMLKKLYKNVPKKVINQNVSKILLKIQKLYFLITFDRDIVLQLFQHIWNQHEILRFLIPISSIKIFFANFQAKCGRNSSK